MVAKASSMPETAGSIMATIITDHMTNSVTRSTRFHASMRGIAAPRPMPTAPPPPISCISQAR